MSHARDRFRIGDHVRFTEEARAVFAPGDGLVAKGRWAGKPIPVTGIVRGFGRQPQLVRVQRDGHGTTGAYPEAYWELDGVRA